MKKLIICAALLGIVSFAGYVGYDYVRGGFHTLPKLNEGEFAISFKSGLRGIMIDHKDQRPQRVYLGVAEEVPHWMEDVWSYCGPPLVEAIPHIPSLGVGTRIEAICTIQVDNDVILRGRIYSRPNL